ncbi:hypothetical protein [Paludisphaera soli]|uniref:hypothetical protein n=1 Tax=Paludisphaera soli TaxID=2712865 RepID=UPI0013EBE6BD|nr:hypothetical protein [Paludisphaera soli]
MLARLWWKEARQAWPIWAFLAASGLALQAFVGWYWGEEAGPGGYVNVALVFTMIYLFLIAAAVFAGERENGTLGMLDVFPIGRPKVWTAKASFTLATTAAMGLLLWLGARLFGVDASEWAKRGGVGSVWALNGLGWGLLWSSLVANALFAALLAMASLCVCLLALVDLNVGPKTFEAAPTLLTLAGLAAGGSAWIFRRTGPPSPSRRSRVRPRVLATAEASPAGTVEVVGPSRPVRVWPTTATRLAWQSLREVRSNLGMLLALGLLPSLLAFANVNHFELDPIVVLCFFATALLTGVAAFQGDNRGRTQRFLLQHGARPGLVWGVKVLIWWGVAMTILCVGGNPLWASIFGRSGGSQAAGLSDVLFASTTLLSIGFAASALCGMVFKRGIMAGAISVVACLALYIPLAGLFASKLLEPWHLPFVAAGLLLVGWAWSGDWMFDRPGLGRWARLGLYAAAVTGALVSSYIGGRVWGVTSLPPGRAEELFQTARITAPIDDAENAAPLYAEAARVLEPNASPVHSEGRPPLPTNETGALVAGDWDVADPALDAWLATIEPGLQKLREASRKPGLQFVEPGRATLFTRTGEPSTFSLLIPLVVSARVKSARGDLDGAWTEIETLIRASRQLSHANSWSVGLLEPAGLGLAMRWAADPRQTVGSLERGLRAYRAIPATASKADGVRMNALVFRNTLELPKDELLDGLFSRWATNRMRIDPMQRLMYDLQSTPWEIARTRRVLDLLAADRIQEISNRPYELTTNRMWTPQVGLVWSESDGKRRLVSHEELARLTERTPLIEHSDLQRDLSWWDRNETARRALNWIFLLRIWQAGHDGAFPERTRLLTDLDVEGIDVQGLLNSPDGRDLYLNGEGFHFIPSEGQSLLSLGSFGPVFPFDTPVQKFEPTAGCWLLYSVGPDGKDDRGRNNLDTNGQGDIIFPLKDDVKPPPAEAR